jgi:two-component system response regulator RegA
MAAPKLAANTYSVLVVEDNDHFRDAVAKNLTQAGFLVESAATEQEAIDKVRRDYYDVAVVDIMLADRVNNRGGFNVIREVHKVNPSTKIVVVSGSADISVAIESYRLHVFEFLQKDLDISEQIVAAANRAAQANDLRESLPPNESAASPMRQRFERLASAWRAETQFSSSVPEIFMNKNYQEIIGQGVAIVPFILEDLKKGSDHWYWALGAITGDNPAENAPPGDIAAISSAWLEWGRRKGIIR